MKIIGKVDKWSYIAQVTGHELDALTGRNESAYPADYHVGDQINIHATWRKLKHVLAIQRDFDAVTKTLSAINDLIDHIGKDIVEKIEVGGREEGVSE